jgi:carbonic anhydrase/acetyltransferase-like protein (isoleucine patch superfamily)
VKLGKQVPVVKDAYIASSATIVGSVNIGSKSSVWYGSVVRGDVNTITIGEGVTIGDRCMVHCAGRGADHPTKIGNNVVLGSGAIVHGSTVGNNVYIGEGAQLLDGSKVGDNCVIAAGAFVSAGKVVPAGQLWSGVPAKYERDLLKDEIAKIGVIAAENMKLAEEHALENAKTWVTIEDEEFDYYQIALRNDDYHRRLTPAQWSERLGDVQGYAVPGRILDSPIAAHTFPESRPDDEVDYPNHPNYQNKLAAEKEALRLSEIKAAQQLSSK